MTAAGGRPPAGVRVRIAPSPTGYMHVGTARTALFNWLFARQQGGAFVLRVEDTDRTRLVPDATDDLMAGLRWLGIVPDEGPGIGGDAGPYLQSERLAIYRPYADRLLAEGHAYRCFCSADRLRAVREARQRAGQKIGYDRHCRDLPPAEGARRAAAGEPHVVRLRMPLAGAATLVDVLRGAIVFDVAEIEDVVLVKTDGFPTYHFAVVVDDHLMGITHVLRADEWIPSAPIQLQLYAAFGWAEPVWAHLPLVLNPDGGGKMSKRKTIGPDGQPIEQMTLVREYQAAGYLPEAMFNFLARLGWSYSGEDEVFSREQALERFRLEDVKPSPAAWNPEKLDWLNGVYIRGLEPADLAARLVPFFERAGLATDAARIRAVVPLIQPRIETLADAPALVDFLWADAVAPAVGEMVPKGLDAADAAELLAAADAALGGLEAWDHAGIEVALRAVAADRGLKAGAAFQPIRLAVTGRSVAPPLFETLEVLGRDATHARIAAARARLAEAAGAGDPAQAPGFGPGG